MDYFVVKFNVNVPRPELKEAATDVLAAMAGELGFESFENTQDGIDGYVQQSLLDEDALKAMVADFPLPDTHILYKVEPMEQQDWNAAWEAEGFEPIRIGREMVIYDPRSTDDGEQLERGFETAAKIQPRMAFGSGTHETTQMLVEWLTEHRPTGRRVLDCGCGTGILAIAAMRLGASEAWAYDIDEWSVENTKDNAALNGVRLNALQGDASVLKKIDGKFGLVMANINRNILLADLPLFVEKLADGGSLLLSGFYEADIPSLTERAQSLGLAMKEQIAKGDWRALVF